MGPGEPLALPLWPLLVFALLLTVKLVDLWERIGVHVESGYSPFAILGFVVFEDGCILGGLLLVSSLGSRLPRVSLVLVVGLLAVYAADVFLIHALFRRLTVLNLLQYAGEVRFLRSFVTPAFALGGPALLLTAWAVRHRMVLAARGPILGAAVVLVLAPWTAAAAKATDPYLELVLPSVLRLNGQLVVWRGVSDGSFERARELYPELWTRMLAESAGARVDPRPAAAGDRTGRPDLILLISESLSRVDSARSGGTYDRLPRIDAVAARGATFTELVSDGNNTTHALAALLAAEEPFPTPAVFGPMQSHYPVEAGARHRALHRSLVEQARSRGYATVFLSNAPLGFQGNGEWLDRLGFDRVEGGEARYYASRPRYSFDSPPDEVLFARALEVLESERDRPLLLVLLTVSLHGPFRTPEAVEGASPLGSALRYVDRTTRDFHDRLERRGYFDSGHLLIIGDHRRMTPLEPRERRELGLDSLGRVLGCLVGPRVAPGTFVRTPLNQTDLHRLTGELIGGSFEVSRGFERFNKGRRYRLDTLFTTHLLSGDRGLVRIRPVGQAPFTVRIAASHDPLAAATGEVERRLAAYVVLRTRLLERRQEAAGP